jgi:hypothetical protein
MLLLGNSMSKLVALMLLTLFLSGLVMVGSAFTQSVPKPSTPEFTIRLVANPYDVPPVTTTTVDQYTGKEIVTTTPGCHVENKSIEIIIKNQPFAPYAHENGYEINLYYSVRSKGHFGDDSDWKELYSRYKDPSSANPAQSSSEYTVLSLSADYPVDSKVDFQVEAIVGHYYDELAGRPILPLYVLAVDESSGWSSTQTLTIGESQPSSEPTPTLPNVGPTSPSGQEPMLTQEQLAGVAVTVAVLTIGLGLLVHLIKRK